MQSFRDGLVPDVLQGCLQRLADHGDTAAWFRLAFLASKNADVARRASVMHRPLVLHVSFEKSDHRRKFIIPFAQAKIVSIEIDWGDGTARQVVTEVGCGYAAHSYELAGDYCVRVFPHGQGVSPTNSGDVKSIWLDHLGWTGGDHTTRIGAHLSGSSWRPIRSFNSWGSLGIRSLSCLFAGAAELTIALPPLVLHQVADLSSMFRETNWWNNAVDHWDVSCVTNMEGLFRSAKGFNQPLSKWNVRNVTNMSLMFAQASKFNQPIGNWDVSKVTSMSLMFDSAEAFNQPIGDWNVGNVQSMTHMFRNATIFNQPIGNWKVGNVLTMKSMFEHAARFNQPLGDWDVSEVTNMACMFHAATSFEQEIGNWNVRRVSDCADMFKDAVSFRLSPPNWDREENNSLEGQWYRTQHTCQIV